MVYAVFSPLMEYVRHISSSPLTDSDFPPSCPRSSCLDSAADAGCRTPHLTLRPSAEREGVTAASLGTMAAFCTQTHPAL